MTNDILDPSALISILQKLLPTASKKLNTPQDALSALIHAAFIAIGFRLVGVDDSAPTRTFPESSLPEEWNAHGPGYYTLMYKHEQSSLDFVIKITKLGSRTVVNAIALESDKAASFDFATNDFTSPSFFPHDLAATDAQPLIHGFIASNRVTDFMLLLKSQIFQKLVPGLRKEGYSEQPTDASTNSTASVSQPRAPNPGPARPQPQSPPFAPLQPGSPYSHLPPTNPLEIGRHDRDPFPQNPFAPPPLFPGAGGDGMFVGPDHPIFGGRGGGGGLPGRMGPWGGDGFLPPMGAPPGARFDPVGPFPGRSPGVPRGPGVFPGGGNLLGPDNDEFMPPGAGDMYM